MTTKKPLALKLADALESSATFEIPLTWLPKELNDAAAELRRLQAEVEALRSAITKLHKAKGRYHTQLAVCDLFKLCGLTAVRPARAGEVK